ncbi:MAG: AtpZ/AtpI family protein [Lachnospiraceae bacterium]|nr:AtpZ/AtpI family protein [Lachnospiraceae bacterium]
MPKVLRKIAFLTQFGLTILIPTCLLFFFGYWLDGKLGTSFLSVLFFFIGALAGITGVWRLIKKELSNDEKDVRNRDMAVPQKDTPSFENERTEEK